jgi:hypothetical protein
MKIEPLNGQGRRSSRWQIGDLYAFLIHSILFEPVLDRRHDLLGATGSNHSIETKIKINIAKKNLDLTNLLAHDGRKCAQVIDEHLQRCR